MIRSRRGSDARAVRVPAALALLSFALGWLMLTRDNPLIQGRDPGGEAMYGGLLAMVVLTLAAICAGVAAWRTHRRAARLDRLTRVLGLAPLALFVVLLLAAVLSGR